MARKTTGRPGQGTGATRKEAVKRARAPVNLQTSNRRFAASAVRRTLVRVRASQPAKKVDIVGSQPLLERALTATVRASAADLPSDLQIDLSGVRTFTGIVDRLAHSIPPPRYICPRGDFRSHAAGRCPIHQVRLTPVPEP